MIDKKLIEQYSGEQALGYDQRRVSTARYAQEVEAFSRLFSAIAPRTVIDCPFGTGRWLDQYLASGATVTGIDASAAMLELARAKPGASSDKIRMVEGSIFDQALFARLGAGGVDLVVCVRFVNWISLPEVEQALKSIGGARPRHVLLGVSLLPRSWGGVERLRARLRLGWRSRALRQQGRPYPRVHDEQAFKALLARTGWRIHRDEFIFRDPVRENHFLHLVPGPAG